MSLKIKNKKIDNQQLLKKMSTQVLYQNISEYLSIPVKLKYHAPNPLMISELI